MAAVALAMALPAMGAQSWTLANEYPAGSLPVEGDEFFASRIAESTAGALVVTVAAGAARGYRSREQLAAVADGRLEMADSFAGALAEDEPLLGLSALPFVVADSREARELYARARPKYEAAFARRGQKLLWATPWPPSGLWTRAQATTPEALAKLRVRTYDRVGTEVMQRVGARASVVPFADLPPRLAAGEFDAVLSSGDGEAARQLWDHLKHFTEIRYAIPLSFATVNLQRYRALDAATRRAVDEAAARTEARQWEELDTRTLRNYQRMRRMDMAIHQPEVLDPRLPAALRRAARPAIDEWLRKAGPEAKALLATP